MSDCFGLMGDCIERWWGCGVHNNWIPVVMLEERLNSDGPVRMNWLALAGWTTTTL